MPSPMLYLIKLLAIAKGSRVTGNICALIGTDARRTPSHATTRRLLHCCLRGALHYAAAACYTLHARARARTARARHDGGIA